MSDRYPINDARKELGLGEKATIPEIKEAYRRLSLRYHPDKCKDRNKKKCEEKFKRINRAKDILIGYCLDYEFPLKEAKRTEDLEDERMKEHIRRFYDGWWRDPDDNGI